LTDDQGLEIVLGVPICASFAVLPALLSTGFQPFFA